MSDKDLSSLGRLFNFAFFEAPVGTDGITLKQPKDFIQTLQALRTRIDSDVYRDALIEAPLPTSHRSLAELDNPGAVQESLKEAEETLRRCEAILKAIDQYEKLKLELRTKETEAEDLRRKIFGWEEWQKAKANLPQLRSQLREIDERLAAAAAQIMKLEKNAASAHAKKNQGKASILEAENQFNAVMGRFNDCIQPDWIKAVIPDEEIPDDFDASVTLFLRQQRQLGEIDGKTRDALTAVEKELGSDYTGADDSETARLLTEELEA